MFAAKAKNRVKTSFKKGSTTFKKLAKALKLLLNRDQQLLKSLKKLLLKRDRQLLKRFKKPKNILLNRDQQLLKSLKKL